MCGNDEPWCVSSSSARPFSLLTFLINFSTAINRCCETKAMKSLSLKVLRPTRENAINRVAHSQKGRSHENFRTRQREERRERVFSDLWRIWEGVAYRATRISSFKIDTNNSVLLKLYWRSMPMHIVVLPYLHYQSIDNMLFASELPPLSNFTAAALSKVNNEDNSTTDPCVMFILWDHFQHDYFKGAKMSKVDHLAFSKELRQHGRLLAVKKNSRRDISWKQVCVRTLLLLAILENNCK